MLSPRPSLVSTAVVLLAVAGAPAAAFPDQEPYRIVAPELAVRGQTFTGWVVEPTPEGDRPAPAGTRLVFRGEVVAAEAAGEGPGVAGEAEVGADGAVTFPAFTDVLGNAFLAASVLPPGAEPVAAVPHHVEVVEVAHDLPTTIAHASDVVAPGGVVRAEGQGLTKLVRAALVDEKGKEHALDAGAGSELQRIWRAPGDLPSGPLRLTAWDAAGHRFEAPEASRNPRVGLRGTEVTHVGQRGAITIRSDADVVVTLAGGEPQITLDKTFTEVPAGATTEVGFTAHQVGQYDVAFVVRGREEAGAAPEAPKADAPRPTLTTRYDPTRDATEVKAESRVVDDGGAPLAGVPVDLLVSHPEGVAFARVETDAAGRAVGRVTVAGRVEGDALAAHLFRVLGHRFKAEGEPVPAARLEECKEKDQFDPGKEVIDVEVDDSYGDEKARAEIEKTLRDGVGKKEDRFRLATPTATAYTFYRTGLVGGSGNAMAKTILLKEGGGTDVLWTTEPMTTAASGQAKIKIDIEADKECTVRITEATLQLLDAVSRIRDPVEDADETSKAVLEGLKLAKDIAKEVAEEVPVLDKVVELLEEQADPTAFIEMSAKAKMSVQADACREQRIRVRGLAQLIRQGDETKKYTKTDHDFDLEIESCSVAQPSLEITLKAEGELSGRAEGSGAGENFLGSAWGNLWVACCDCPGKTKAYRVGGSSAGFFESKADPVDPVAGAERLLGEAQDRLLEDLKDGDLDPCDADALRRRLETELETWIKALAKEYGLYKGTEVNPGK
jgi:hypothetical protein